MLPLKRHFARISLGLLTAAVALGMAVPAFADTGTDDTNLTVSPSILSWTAPTIGDLNGITLSGANQIVSATMTAFQVVDARGSGAGWNVTVSATQLKEYSGGAYVNGGKSIATGTMTMSEPSIAPGTGSSANPAQNADATAAHLIDGGAYTVVAAQADTGMGTYDFGTATVKVTIPADTYAKSYRSDVTVTLSNTP